MSGSLQRKVRRRQRGRSCGPDVDDALRAICETHDHIGAERLKPNLVEMATDLTRRGELEASPGLLDQLSRISVSTVRRILSRLGQDEPRLPRKGPAQADRAARETPVKRISYPGPPTSLAHARRFGPIRGSNLRCRPMFDRHRPRRHAGRLVVAKTSNLGYVIRCGCV